MALTATTVLRPQLQYWFIFVILCVVPRLRSEQGESPFDFELAVYAWLSTSGAIA